MVMNTQEKSVRQRIRKGAILVSLLLFPVTLFYFSPVLILESAAEGLVNGSLIVFTVMFFGAMVLGRAWCGWACPGAGLQEMLAPINDQRLEQPRDWIKWAIWIPWAVSIALTVFFAGGYNGVDFFYQTHNGISVTNTFGYVIYYSVLTLFITVALVSGRRGACHRICWMSPFMILGRTVGNTLRLPSLHLAADASRCVKCQSCTKHCSMSLDVTQLVQAGTLEHAECILCGKCVDTCKQGAIRFTFGNYH
jgi:ferredoxin-type protein NapH